MLIAFEQTSNKELRVVAEVSRSNIDASSAQKSTKSNVYKLHGRTWDPYYTRSDIAVQILGQLCTAFFIFVGSCHLSRLCPEMQVIRCVLNF